MILAGAAVLHYAGERGHEARRRRRRSTTRRWRRPPARHPHPRPRRRTPGRTEFTDAGRASRRRSGSPARDRIALMEAGQLTGAAPAASGRRAQATGRPSTRRWSRWSVMVLVALALIADRGLQPSRSGPSTASSRARYFALGAIGLTLVYGILKLVNFAQGDFLTFGAYIAFAFNVSIGHAADRGAADRDRRDRAARRLPRADHVAADAQARRPGCCSCC